MKIAVLGIWHLGSVVSACIASPKNKVFAIDTDELKIEKLNNSKAPIFEPNLNQIIEKKLKSNQLSFHSSINFVSNVDILWVTYDTPVDNDDNADIDFVIENIKQALDFVSNKTLVLISSQLPVGSIRKLEKYADSHLSNKNITFACSPENLRLGSSIKYFSDPDRVIMGIRDKKDLKKINKLFEETTNNIEIMSVESAEMTKHAINSFLATSVTFANEIASICELVGADAKEVERGLKTESRIGPKAYLSPGSAFAGGTLARDIQFLNSQSNDHISTPLLSSIKISNDEHKYWIRRKISENFSIIKDLKVCVWGLTYKPETDTLRRSLSIELCNWLYDEGALINAYDPVIKALPAKLEKRINLFNDPGAAMADCDVLVIGTEWKILKDLNVITTKEKNLLVLDPNRFIYDQCLHEGIKYFSVGSTYTGVDKL